MTGWFIKACVYAPYPLNFEYQVNCSAPSTAAGRAIRLLRQENRLKGRRLKEYSLSIKKL